MSRFVQLPFLHALSIASPGVVDCAAESMHDNDSMQIASPSKSILVEQSICHFIFYSNKSTTKPDAVYLSLDPSHTANNTSDNLLITPCFNHVDHIMASVLLQGIYEALVMRSIQEENKAVIDDIPFHILWKKEYVYRFI